MRKLHNTYMPAVGDYVYELHETWQGVLQKLLAQAEKDKARVDCVKRSSDIPVGDQVLLSMKHLRLKGKPGKLYPILLGPFRVPQEIERNAMKLDLPASMLVHPVFHVHLL